ncbi:hypothetical protein BCR36DRAFT_287585 [Piromyces finnis]|uniref:Fibronectin type-III domain-containing protein n=1 Tax=Piromyces finnis TaxID=1754191 RepID=A0A1Y1VCL6_9FUNG|nr:hypothetical protein BCR36DRAFT_287585 [Piromyces finnis]|eukprot:ORX51848.1 hypothetical protein BCR36DRAFT_287585 [Piromyces finnis]
MACSILSSTTNIKFDWMYFTLISFKVLINANYIGFAPLVLIISLYLFLDIIVYLSIPYLILSEVLDICIPCVMCYCIRKLGFIRDFKLDYIHIVTASFLIIQMVIWVGFFINPFSVIIKYIASLLLVSNSRIKADTKKSLMFTIISNDKKDFGDGILGLIKLWKFEFNKVLAAHCITFLIFLIILYIYYTIKSNFEFICSLIGIIIPRAPVITIKDLTENSVELYWNEPIEQDKSIKNLKDIINLICYTISYPFSRYKNKNNSSSSSSSSKQDVDNTLSDLISISKQHGEDTYHFSLNNKDTTTNNNKLKFPKSTLTTNFKTIHYDKNLDYTNELKDQNKDNNISLDTNEENSSDRTDISKNTESFNNNPTNNKNSGSNNTNNNKDNNSNKRIGYTIKKGKSKANELDKSEKILLGGKEVDIKNFASEIKKEFNQLDKTYSYEKTLKNTSGFKYFLYKYGFQKRNEITYQVEINCYILNEENLSDKHIIINGLKPSTSYKIRVWAVLNNRIKSPSSFVNIKTLKSYTDSLNKVEKTDVNEKITESYEDHLKSIAEIDSNIDEINKEFERLKKQRLEFAKQVNDINDQYKEEEIPLKKQLDELKLEKNEVDEVKLQHKGILKELKEEKRRVDFLKSQREQKLKTKERGKQQLIDRCNRCQNDINKLKKDIQRLEEKEESLNIDYDNAKKAYVEEKDRYMKEQVQLKDKLKEEKKNHKALVKEFNDKKSKYKQVEISHKKFMQDNRERNKEKLKVDEEYKILAKKYKELKEKNNTLKNQLKIENNEKIKLLQSLNEIHQQSDSDSDISSDSVEDIDDPLDPIDSILDDLTSSSTLSKLNSDLSITTPSYSNTNSISRNSSEESTNIRTSEFNLFNHVETDNYEGNQKDKHYSKPSRNSSPLIPVIKGNSFGNRNDSRYTTTSHTSSMNKKINPIKSSRFYSYPLEQQQNSFNVNGYNKKSSQEPTSSLFERNSMTYNDSRAGDTNDKKFSSPKQSHKQTPKMKNLIPFFSYNSYIPTTETATDSKLLNTSLEDDLMTDTSNMNVNSTTKASKNVFNSANDKILSPLLGSLSQKNISNSKVSPNINSSFSPQISSLSPLLLNENNQINSKSQNKEFNALSTNNPYNSGLFSNILKNNYNSLGLGNQGSSTSSLNTNSLYASINNPIGSEASSGNLYSSKTNPIGSEASTGNFNNSTNNLGFLFSGGLGKDTSLSGFSNSSSSVIDNAFHSPRASNTQLNSGNDIVKSNSIGSESGLPRNTYSPLISPQSKNSSLMSGFSSIPSYYQNINMSNDVNDLLGSNASPLDTTNRVNEKLNETNERNNNSFSNNSSPNSYLFNNYFSMNNYPKNNSTESNKDNYLHDYLNSRLANYQSFYNRPIFNSGLTSSLFNEPTSNGAFNSINGMSNTDQDFNQQNNNDLNDEEIDLNFDYDYKLSDSESEDIETSDIDISKIIDLSKQKENSK